MQATRAGGGSVHMTVRRQDVPQTKAGPRWQAPLLRPHGRRPRGGAGSPIVPTAAPNPKMKEAWTGVPLGKWPCPACCPGPRKNSLLAALQRLCFALSAANCYQRLLRRLGCAQVRRQGRAAGSEAHCAAERLFLIGQPRMTFRKPAVASAGFSQPSQLRKVVGGEAARRWHLMAS